MHISCLKKYAFKLRSDANILFDCRCILWHSSAQIYEQEWKFDSEKPINTHLWFKKIMYMFCKILCLYETEFENNILCKSTRCFQNIWATALSRPIACISKFFKHRRSICHELLIIKIPPLSLLLRNFPRNFGLGF